MPFIRYGDEDDLPLVIASNYTPVPRNSYRIGVPQAGYYPGSLQ
ncbi:MAG: hypothetical protein R3C11_20725 [Planctomycetaceae bacterium]